MDGFKGRFCQQCSRVHDLSRFDGDKRGCRQRLKMRHIARYMPYFFIDTARALRTGVARMCCVVPPSTANNISSETMTDIIVATNIKYFLQITQKVSFSYIPAGIILSWLLLLTCSTGYRVSDKYYCYILSIEVKSNVSSAGCRRSSISRLRASRAAPSAATLAVGDDDNSSNNKLVVTANINSSSRDSDVGSGLSSSPPPRIRTITHPPPAPILAAGGVYQGVGWWETDVEVFVADKKHLMRHSRLLGLPYSSRRTTAAEDSLSKSLAWTLSVPSSAGSSSGSSQRVPHAPARPTSNHDYPSFELMNYLDSSAAGILNTVASDDDGIRRRLYWTQQFGTTEGKSVSAPLPQQSSCDPIDQQSLTTYSALLATCGSAYNGRFMMADANLSGMAESSAGAYQPADWFGDEGDDTATNNMNNPDQSLLSSQDYYDGRPESWPSGYSSMQHGHHQPAVSACYPDCSEMISHNTATNIKFSRTWYEQHHDNLSS